VADYRVVLASSAEREFDRLPSDVQERAIELIDRLSQSPRFRGVIKLRGRTNLWRARIGDYRCIYHIDDQQRLVDITHIRHRKDAYD
jgi:mRNA interferase RelE/StbE